jgi:hypothetical protein
MVSSKSEPLNVNEKDLHKRILSSQIHESLQISILILQMGILLQRDNN